MARDMRPKAARAKKLNRSKAGNAFIFIMLFGLGLFMALPIYYIIIQSVKPFEEMFVFPPRLYVLRPTTAHFSSLFELVSGMWVPFERFIFNSLFVSAAGTAGHVLLASMAAYPLAKHPFPGSKALFNVIVLSLLFTPYVTAIPQYIVMARMNLVDTYFALILPTFSMSLGLYLMRQFMLNIPDAMLEAAKIDGAGEFRIFFLIVMPQVRPAWLTLIIFAFQAIWNQTGFNFVFSDQYKVLPTVFRNIAAGGFVRSGVSSAASFLLLLPPVLIFLFAQRNVIETMSHSGIKE